MSAFAGVSASQVLVEAMKVAETNYCYIVNNVANADTPHYNPVELDFQRTLRAAVEGRGAIALRTTRPRHLDFQSHRPHFERIAYLSKNDYNKVDLDDQMAKLSKNTSDYTTYAALLNKRFEQVRSMLNQLQR